MFKTYNVTAKLSIMYASIIAKYSDLLFSSKCQRLLTRNPPRGPKTVTKQTLICEEALNNFTLQTWPNNGLASLKFPIIWRQYLVKVVFRIISVKKLQKKLLPSYLLYFSSLGIIANKLVNIIVIFIQTLIVLTLLAAPPIALLVAPPVTPLAILPAAPQAVLSVTSSATPLATPPAALLAALLIVISTISPMALPSTQNAANLVKTLH